MTDIGYGVSNTDPSQGPVINLPTMGTPPVDFTQLEAQHGLPTGLLSAVMQQESGGNPNAVNNNTATGQPSIGAFQFQPATAAQYGINPNDPTQAAQGAAQMFGDLSKKYNGDLPSMLAGYNWGQGNVDRHGLKNAPPETQNYISTIMGKLGNAIVPAAEAADSKEVTDPDLIAKLDNSVAQTQSQEVTDPDLIRQLDAQASPSIGKTAADQAVQGATFGFGDEAEAGLASLALSAMNGKSIPENYEAAHAYAQNQLQQEQQQNPGTSIAANLAGGLATGLVGAGTGAGAAVADSLGSGNIWARMAKSALAGGTSGALYGAGSADEGNRLEGAEQGGTLGASFGGAIPGVTGALGAVKNAVVPAVSDTLRPLAQKALNYGIPLARTQIGDSKIAKTLASTVNELPFSGSPAFFQKQQGAFNKAISSTIGENSTKITPDLIDDAYKNIGQKFDDVLKGKTVQISNQYINDLAALEGETHSQITGEHVKIVQNQIDNLLKDISKNGTISGEKLGSFRSALTKTLSSVRNDASPFLQRLRDIVIDMSTDGVPGARAKLNEARLQYKNLKTIEPLAAKAVDGNISPSLLLGRVMGQFKDFPRGGGGQLGDLARIGQAFLKDTIPNSGTAKRLAAYTALFEAPALIASGPAGMAAAGAKAAGGLGLARGFNTMNISQRMVKNAVKKGAAKPMKTTGILPGNIAGQIESPR